jgi:tRNA threonylcarbamoyladenosine biosynthesis protein TsaB
MILAIDTSTPRGTIALLDTRSDALLFSESFPCDRSQGSDLYLHLAHARSLAPQIGQIAIGIGPGSYAGVRIAIASALGLSLSCGATLVALASVAALATDAPEFIAIGDARRDAYYYSRIRDGLCVEAPQLLDGPALSEKLAAHSDIPVFTTATIPAFPQATIALPCAARLARLAAAQKGILATGDFEPLYLREPYITQPKAAK